MTSIAEEEYDKKINISKYDFSCDDEDMSIPDPLPKKSFSMLIVGKPGTGKTNLLLNLITKQGKAFNKKFDKVFIFSPSLGTIKGDDPFELIPDNQKYSEATLDNIDNFLEQIVDTGEKVLLILDDVVADIRGKGKGEIENKLHQIIFPY